MLSKRDWVAFQHHISLNIQHQYVINDINECLKNVAKNESTLARCSSVKHRLILTILGKQHEQWAHFQKLYAYSTFVVSSLLLTLFALNSCDGNDTKHNAFSVVDCWWLWKQTMPLKSVRVLFKQMFKVMFFHLHLLFPLTNSFVNDILWYISHVSMRRCFK